MLKYVILISLVVIGSRVGISATGSEEYEEMNQWLFEYILNGVTPQTNNEEYGHLKDEWYQYGENIYDKIKSSLPPIDPSITAEIAQLRNDMYAQRETDAVSLGYASYDELLLDAKKGEEPPNEEVAAFFEKYRLEYESLNDKIKMLTKDYDDELQRRFENAFIDAVKKLKENSESMQ